MNDLDRFKEISANIITISQVASIAITAIISTYNFIEDNKDKYKSFFDTVLRYMDSMEIDSKLTGSQKKAAVLAKVKEIALELMFNWEDIFEIVSSLIDDAKTIYKQIIEEVKTAILEFPNLAKNVELSKNETSNLNKIFNNQIGIK